MAQLYPNSLYKRMEKGSKFILEQDLRLKESRIIGKRTGWKYNQFNDEDIALLNAKKEDIIYVIDLVATGDDSLGVSSSVYTKYFKDKPSLDKVLNFLDSLGVYYDFSDFKKYGIKLKGNIVSEKV